VKTLLLFLVPCFLVIVFSSQKAFACSCLGRNTPVTEYKQVDAVFVGTVSKLGRRDSTFSDLRASFTISEGLKGAGSENIDVYTSSQGTACGFPFEEGSTYLVYAHRDPQTKELSTSICGRTRTLSFGYVDDEVEILRSLSAGKLKPRIYGTVYELTRGLYPLRQDYWAERKPMSGVKIVAKKSNETFEAVSDSRGMFSIADLQNGKYRLDFILPPGYKLGGDYWDESTKEERNKYRNIVLAITDSDLPDRLEVETRIDGRITGKVIDVSKKPVGKDVRISLVSKQTAQNEVGDIDYVPAYTDRNGNFEFFGIPPGEYYLGFNLETKPNKNFPYPRTYFPGTSNISDAKLIKLDKASKLDGFVLSLPAKVEEVLVKGKVVDLNSQPVKGAVVERYGLYYGEWKEGEPYSMKSIKQPTFEGRVETNEKGEFSLILLKGNKYRLNPFLPSKNSYKDLLEGEEVDIEVDYDMNPVLLVLDKKPD